jgi:hypothetical protein
VDDGCNGHDWKWWKTWDSNQISVIQT